MELKNYFKATTPKVGQRMKKLIRAQPKIFRPMMTFAFMRGGKRLRPVLCQLISDSLDGDSDKALTCGSIVEFVHAGSLALDDLIDVDLKRRGLPSLWTVFGSGRSLFTSITSFAGVIRVTAEMGGEYAGVAARALGELCEGGTLNLMLKEPKRADYMYMVERKTGTLFKAACEFGSMCAGAKEGTKEAFMIYGRSLGMAYQLTDDLTSLWRTLDTGKPQEDFKQRQLSFPMVVAGGSEIKEFLDGRLGWKEVVNHIRQSGAEEACMAEIRKYIEIAKANIPKVKREFRPLLEEFPRFAVNALVSEADRKVI